MSFGLHDPWMILPCAAQVALWFIVLHFVVSHPKLTVRPVWLPSAWVPAGHGLVRLIAALAYIGAIIGAAASGWGVIEGDAAVNRVGIIISRVSGVVIAFHVAGIFWQFVVLLGALGTACGLSRAELVDLVEGVVMAKAGRRGVLLAGRLSRRIK